MVFFRSVSAAFALLVASSVPFAMASPHGAAVVLKTSTGTRRLRVTDKLGKGFFARVHGAVDDAASDETLAVKLRHDPNAADSFDLEAQVGTEVRSPRLMKVLGIGHREDTGQRALVMRRVPGERLKNRLPLPPADAVRVIGEALEGLRDLHAQGWTSGDFNWSNVMVDRPGVTSLVDYGASQPRTTAGVAGDLRRVGMVLTAAVLGVRGELVKTVFPSSADELPESVTDVRGRVVPLRAIARAGMEGRYSSAAEMLEALQGTEAPIAAHQPDAPHQTIHGYTIESRGHKGILFVRAAYGPRRAIKRMSVDAARWEFDVYKQLEAAGNPHVPRAYELFVEGGQGYLVMDRGGQRVSELVASRGGKLEPALAVAITLSLLRALETWHLGGYLHRDTHQDNLLIWNADPRTGMLTDAGQAVRRGVDGAWRVRNGGGNADLMAPEQVSQGDAVLTPAADLYQVAATCATLMMGRAPFVARPGQPMSAVFAASPVWSEHWLRILRHGPDLSGIGDPGLRAVLTKAMSYRAGDRYQTAGELLAALQPFAGGFVPSPAARFPPPAIADGELVKEGDQPAIYVAQGGKLHWIPNPTAFVRAGFRWSDVRLVAAGALAQLPRANWADYISRATTLR
jgi:serine/threonine protein kinase